MPAGASRTRGRPSRFFLDTNIFVYTFDHAAPLRRAKARELVEVALTTGLGVVSHQVVQEFLNVASKKFAVPLASADLRTYLERVLVPLWHVSPSADLHRQALDVQERSGYGLYDSLIVAAALASGCRVLYSQDLQNGRRFGSLTVADPFAE
ncbi:MAG: PIN domain-containing protein [Thermoleophilia bacterium]|nr:PIN domain-containing protein [Thermoleophilia bacterium]